MKLNPSKLQACKEAALLPLQETIRKMSAEKYIVSNKNKPIMSAQLEEQIQSALSQYTKRVLWEKWGMHKVRDQGNCVLLEGPPGTGKTKIAQYMSKRLNRGMETLSMADIGGKEPGHAERMLIEIFAKCKRENGKTLFIDECEAIAWDRTKLGSDSVWMVGVIDQLLVQIAKAKFLIVAATNIPGMVDAALKSRCFAILQVGVPEQAERLRLWKQKIPDAFPVKLTPIQLDILSQYILTGRQIENVLIKEASLAIARDEEPSFKGLRHVAETQAGQ